MSYSTRYAARKRKEFSDRGDTPQAIAERIRHRAICESVARDLAQRFPVLTSENIAEALLWQESEIARRNAAQEAK